MSISDPLTAIISLKTPNVILLIIVKSKMLQPILSWEKIQERGWVEALTAKYGPTIYEHGRRQRGGSGLSPPGFSYMVPI